MRINKPTYTQQKYYSSNPFRRFFIRSFLKRILKEIKNQKAINILDVGCGEGQADKYFFKNLPKIQITGIDSDENALNQAKKDCPKMTIKKVDIYHLPFADHSFDLLICLEVLEHLDNPQKALQEIKRVGKKFIVSVPYEPFFSLLSLFSGKYLKTLGHHPEHLQFWSKKSFTKFMGKEPPKVTIRISFPWLIAKGEL